MTQFPLVSVIIAAYNSESFINDCINSVLQQSWPSLEIIVCDDGSTDNTALQVKRYGDKVRYIYQENQGQGAGRNHAARYATGEYLAFIDHDDRWLPEKIEKQIAVFLSDETLALVYCDMKIVDAKGKLLGYNAKGHMKRGMIFGELIRRSMCGLSSQIVRKKCFDEVGGFSDHYCCPDFVLLCKLAYRYPFDFVEEPLVLYRWHENSLSQQLDLLYPERIDIRKKLKEQYPLTKVQARALALKIRQLYYTYAWLTFLQGRTEKAAQIIRDAAVNGPLYWRIYIVKLFTLVPFRLLSPIIIKWHTWYKSSRLGIFF